MLNYQFFGAVINRLTVVLLAVCFLIPALSIAGDNCKSHDADVKSKPHDDKSKTHDDDGDNEHSESAPEVSFSVDVINKYGIKIETAMPETIYKTVDGPGEILLNEDNVAHVSPKVAGVAKKIYKSLGDKVQEGEILALFESSSLGEAKIEYYTAKTKLDLAKLDYKKDEKVYQNTKTLLELLKNGQEPSEIIAKTEHTPVGEVKTKLLTAYSQRRQLEFALSRSDKLQSKGVVSVADLELKSKEYQSANAAFRGAVEDVELSIEQIILKSHRELMIAETAMSNAERKLYMIGLGKDDIAHMEKNQSDKLVSSYQLKSPINGVVIERHLANGEHADQNNNSFTVADLSSLWCDIRLRPKDLTGIVRGSKVFIKSDTGNFDGEISTISPVIEEKTRAGFVRVIIKNPDNTLKPGLFVDGKVTIAAIPVNVAVPVDAIQTLDDKDVVFKQGCKANEFVAQPVIKGICDDRNVEIIDGIKTGDKIAVKGTFLIKAEFAKGKAGGCADAH